jgi:hypothetical protein
MSVRDRHHPVQHAPDVPQAGPDRTLPGRTNLFDNYWVLMLIKALAIIALVLTCFLVIAYMEHKVMAHMQARLGPMEAGRYHGVLQIVVDGIKFVQKESIIPRAPTAGCSPWPRRSP